MTLASPYQRWFDADTLFNLLLGCAKAGHQKSLESEDVQKILFGVAFPVVEKEWKVMHGDIQQSQSRRSIRSVAATPLFQSIASSVFLSSTWLKHDHSH